MNRLLLLPVLLVCFAGACGSGDETKAPFPETPFQTITSDAGKLLLEIRTSPQPPAKGPADVEIRAFDAETSAPVDDLVIRVSPWMGSMGHGSNSVDSVPQGDGRHVAKEVLFSMSGKWELKLAISGEVEDTAETPSFEVRP